MIEIALLGIVAGGVLAYKMLTGKRDADVDKVWQEAARRLRGELTVVPGSFLRSTRRQISAAVEEVSLTVDVFEESDGRSYVEFTRVVSGALPGAATVRLEVSPRSIVRRLSMRLGVGEIPTGDERFDEACYVVAVPAALAIEYLDAPTRRLLATMGEGFSIEEGVLRIVRRGVPDEAEPVVDMARFASRLVERWCAMVRAPARLATRLGLSLEEGFALPDEGEHVVARGLRRGRTVTLLVRMSAKGLESVVTFADVELAFAGLAPDADEVTSSVDTEIDRLGSSAAYR